MPTTHRVQIESGEEFACETTDTLTRAGLRAGFGMPYECNAGGCGTCRYELLEGEVFDAYPAAPALTDRDRKRGRRLACQSRPLGNVRVRVSLSEEHRPRTCPRRIPAKLESVRAVTHDIAEFRFSLASAQSFLPGQYALLDVPGASASRAYSMSNLAGDGTVWEFQVRRSPKGEVSHLLFDSVKPGETLIIDGPYGNAYLREDAPRDVICVAGGSGLSPMLSIARGFAASSALAGRQLQFFMGGRAPRDIAGEHELCMLTGYGERILFHPAVSDAPGDADWSGAVGLIHEIVAMRLTDTLPRFEWYFAGPPPMVNAVEALLVGAGVPLEQLHFDRYF